MTTLCRLLGNLKKATLLQKKKKSIFIECERHRDFHPFIRVSNIHNSTGEDRCLALCLGLPDEWQGPLCLSLHLLTPMDYWLLGVLVALMAQSTRFMIHTQETWIVFSTPDWSRSIWVTCEYLGEWTSMNEQLYWKQCSQGWNQTLGYGTWSSKVVAKPL